MDVIRLDVGGTIFATTWTTLRGEPGNMLAKLGGDGYPLHLQSNGAIFIDRDPRVFHLILNYLRTKRLSLDELTYWELAALRTENDFYSIESLDKVLNPPGFFGTCPEGITLSERGRVVKSTNACSRVYTVFSRAAFGPTRRKMTVSVDRVSSNSRFFIGVSPYFTEGASLGAFVKLEARSPNPLIRSPLDLVEGAEIIVWLDCNFNVIVRMGSETMMCNPPIAEDYTTPLHLCIIFGGEPSVVRLL